MSIGHDAEPEGEGEMRAHVGPIADGPRGARAKRLRSWLRLGLISGALLLALLMLSVPRVAQSLGLQPPPGPTSTSMD